MHFALLYSVSSNVAEKKPKQNIKEIKPCKPRDSSYIHRYIHLYWLNWVGPKQSANTLYAICLPRIFSFGHF